MSNSTALMPAQDSTRRTLALATILAAQLMLQMDFLIVMVALPRMQADLGFSAAALSWVPNAFALAFGGLLLLGGRLGDVFGRVRVFQVGAAIAAPSVLALITTLARDDAERNRGMGLFIAVSSVGASAGLILGGALTAYLSWRWSLLINVPFGLLVLTMIGPLVPETARQPGAFDIGGAVTATLGSIALVFGFINAADYGFLSLTTELAFLLAAVLLVGFFALEARVRQPLLDLQLLRHRPRIVALLVMAMILGGHLAMLFLVVQYLQQTLGFGPLASGLAYLPITGTVFVVTHFMPRLIPRFGEIKLLRVGCVLVAASFIGLAWLDSHGSYAASVLGPMVLHSIGLALVLTPATVLAMKDVPADQAGAASGLVQMDQQIGGALGVAVLTAAYAAASVPGDFAAGLPVAFGLAAVIAMLALGVTLLSRKEG
jgi:MFS family permease